MPDRRNTRLQVKTSPAKVDAMSSATASSSSAAPPPEPGLNQFDVDEDSDHGMGLSHCMNFVLIKQLKPALVLMLKLIKNQFLTEKTIFIQIYLKVIKSPSLITL